MTSASYWFTYVAGLKLGQPGIRPAPVRCRPVL